MEPLLIYRPLRDGWLSWPCWLTDSGRLNHKVVIHPACSLAQDRESSPAETSVLTTMLRRQQYPLICTFSVHKILKMFPMKRRIVGVGDFGLQKYNG